MVRYILEEKLSRQKIERPIVYYGVVAFRVEVVYILFAFSHDCPHFLYFAKAKKKERENERKKKANT